MLKPSKKAGGAPLVNEGKAGGGSSRPARPNLPGSTHNRVIVSEAKGSGKHKGTFTAPRMAAGEDDISRGYKKVG